MDLWLILLIFVVTPIIHIVVIGGIEDVLHHWAEHGHATPPTR